MARSEGHYGLSRSLQLRTKRAVPRGCGLQAHRDHRAVFFHAQSNRICAVQGNVHPTDASYVNKAALDRADDSLRAIVHVEAHKNDADMALYGGLGNP